MNLAQIDCTAHDSKELCNLYQIKGYPTIHFLKEAKSYKFIERRDINELISFVYRDYKKSEYENKGIIPVKLEGPEKLIKLSYDVLCDIFDALDVIFERIGLKFVPS